MPFFSETSIFSRNSEEWSRLLYDDRPMCSIPAPLYYSIGLSGAHLFSSPIYFAAFYALYFESSPSFKGYKRYLGVHAVSNFLFEFYLSVAMKPILYLPNRTARFAGAYFFRFLNGALIVFVFLLICLSTCVSILEMIHYRFKLVSEISSSEKWVRQWVMAIKYWRTFIYLLACCVIFSYVMCGGGQFEQPEMKLTLGEKFIETYPEIMCTSALIVPVGSLYELKPVHVFNFFTLFALSTGFLLCTCMSSVILLSLKGLMSRCSLKTIQMHKLLLYSIFVQVSVHGIMLGFPILIYVIVMVCKFDGNEVGYFAIIIASLHGALSTLAMIIFNRPLYQIVTNKWKHLFTPNYVHMVPVSFISSESSHRKDTLPPL